MLWSWCPLCCSLGCHGGPLGPRPHQEAGPRAAGGQPLLTDCHWAAASPTLCGGWRVSSHYSHSSHCPPYLLSKLTMRKVERRVLRHWPAARAELSCPAGWGWQCENCNENWENWSSVIQQYSFTSPGPASLQHHYGHQHHHTIPYTYFIHLETSNQLLFYYST